MTLESISLYALVAATALALMGPVSTAAMGHLNLTMDSVAAPISDTDTEPSVRVVDHAATVTLDGLR